MQVYSQIHAYAQGKQRPVSSSGLQPKQTHARTHTHTHTYFDSSPLTYDSIMNEFMYAKMLVAKQTYTRTCPDAANLDSALDESGTDFAALEAGSTLQEMAARIPNARLTDVCVDLKDFHHHHHHHHHQVVCIINCMHL